MRRRSNRLSQLVDAASLPGARRGPLPDALALPSRVRADRPPEGDGWLHELDRQGLVLGARVHDGAASWLGPETPPALPELERALAHLAAGGGLFLVELAAVTADGRYGRRVLDDALEHGWQAPCRLFVSDVLHFEGFDLGAVPLFMRKRLLRWLFLCRSVRPCLRFSEHVAGSGTAFWRRARAMGFDAIVCRRRDGLYTPPSAECAYRVPTCGAASRAA